MSAIVTLTFDAYAELIEGVALDIGATVLWTFNCQDPFTRAALDLSGAGEALQMSLSAPDLRGNPTQPPVFSRQATINTPATGGIITVVWTLGDTVPSGVPLAAGLYIADLWRTDGAGNRYRLARLLLDLRAPATLPATPVTPAPSQPPLGLGQGFAWRGTWSNATQYNPYDVVSYVINGTTSTYLCTARPPVGTLPTNGTYWALMVGGINGFAGAFTQSNRPAANTITQGFYIYNLTSFQPQWTDGTNWRDVFGNLV